MCYIHWPLVVTILCAVLFVVCYDIHRRNVTAVVEKGIKCFECTSHSGMNLTEPGLPFENQCESSPKNVRHCASGEMCVSGTVERRGMRRFIRKCTMRAELANECEKKDRPFKFNFCYCNTDLCNI